MAFAGSSGSFRDSLMIRMRISVFFRMGIFEYRRRKKL